MLLVYQVAQTEMFDVELNFGGSKRRGMRVEKRGWPRVRRIELGKE